MIKVLELFAGYGSQALALENLGIEFTSDISEIDKYAIQAYNQLHGETHNWGDITKIDETKLPYYDLITYSSPCQDFSVAGLGKGGDLGSGTRSSLLWECERIIRAVRPRYLLMENVKNLVGKKHKHNFIKWLKVLEGLGYQNFWKVLNAKDCGVPQNRERVFVVSILGAGQYLFPNPTPLTRKLKDVLEQVVDEKYYLSQDKVDKLVMNMDKEVSNTIRCGGGSLDGNSPTLNTMQGGQREPKILDEQNGYIRKDECVGTLTTDGSSPKHNSRVIENGYRIRKLTPLECWRLMGVKDEQFDKLHGISNSQLYKLAGNSIVVDVLMGIFRNLLQPDEETKGQLNLFGGLK